MTWGAERWAGPVPFHEEPAAIERPCHGGYWCEVFVRCPDGGPEWLLGGNREATPAAAVRWLVRQADRMADALDPAPAAGCPYPVAGLEPAVPSAATKLADFFREWARDSAHHACQGDTLRAGGHISINAQGPDCITGGAPIRVWYSLSARPCRTRETT